MDFDKTLYDKVTNFCIIIFYFGLVTFGYNLHTLCEAHVTEQKQFMQDGLIWKPSLFKIHF